MLRVIFLKFSNIFHITNYFFSFLLYNFNIMETFKYYNKLFENYYKKTCENTPIFTFFNTNNITKLKELIYDYFGNSSNILIEKTIDNYFTEPYYPFLDIIDNFLKNKTLTEIENIFDICEVYHFHKDIFIDYFTKKTTNRIEDIIFGELKFEKQKIINSIIKLFFYFINLSDEPKIIVIQCFDKIKYSSIEIIKKFLKVKTKGKVLIFFLFNKDELINIDTENYFSNFVEFIEKNKLSMDLTFQIHKEKLLSKYPNGNNENPLKLIDLSQNCFNLCALFDAKEYIEKIYNQYLNNYNKIEDNYYIKMLMIFGDVNYYLGNHNIAFIYYYQLLDFGQKYNNKKVISISYQKIGILYLEKGEYEKALNITKLSFKIAKEIKEKSLIFKSMFILYQYESKLKKMNVNKWNNFYKKLIYYCKKLNMLNTLIYLYSDYSNHTKFNSILHNKGIKLSIKYKNYYRLSSAYQTKGIVYSVLGNYSKVLSFFEKSKEIKLKLKNKLELSYIYNGLGFFNYLIGKYQKSDFFYAKALDCLFKVKNYLEITNTFLNIASNYFLTLQYKDSLRFLENMLKLMQLLKINNLPYHSLFRIYSLLGIVYYKTGNLDKCYEIYTKIKNTKLKPYPKKNEEYFLYFLFNAFISKEKNKLDKAKLYFERAYYFSQKTNDVITYFTPMFYYEYGLFYEEQKDIPKAKQNYKKGFAYAKKLNLVFYQKLLYSKLKDKKFKLSFNFISKKIKLKYFYDAAKLELGLLDFQRRVSHINFLSNLQNILVNSYDKEILIDNVIKLIENSFLADSIFFIKKQEKSWKISFKKKSSNKIKLSKDDIKKIVSFEESHLILNIEKNIFSFDFHSIIAVPVMTKDKIYSTICLISLTDEYKLTHNELKMLSIGANQLAITLEKIEQGEEIIKNIFDSFPSMLVYANRDGIITQWNDAVEKYTNISKNDAISKNLWQIVDFFNNFKKDFEKVIQNSDKIELYKQILNPNEKKYFNVSIYPLDYRGVKGGVIKIDDVTELEKKDNQLRQAQKMETVGTLAGGLAHDFNNVLGGISGTATLMKYLLQKDQIDINEMKENVDFIEEAVKRSTDMIKHLLALSKKYELSFVTIDLNDSIKRVIKICQTTFDKSVEIKSSYYWEKAHCVGDPAQIEQVVLNLCINAMHAMTIMRQENEKQGGILHISIEKKEIDDYFRINHSKASENIYWIIIISDNGVGIHSEDITKIFDPFFTTKHGKGTGLGLSMAYSIIEQHKGFIDVYSEYNIGTTFNVYLPVSENPNEIISKEKEQIEDFTGSGLILIIDDDFMVRSTAIKILKHCGYDVIDADNGETGIKLFKYKQNDIKIVILDMAMPKMSGKEVYLELKKIKPNVKVLLSSGFKQDDRVMDILNLGVNDFLQKPYTMKELALKLKVIIG
ncbi:MAG: hypothetical protein A2Z98_09120 [Spirochaetes bacterium GWB1_27_13]|nr:MAG: hypothetical protein A2Z98_09120 [Spirochaetes bacterium GWB1_27_13]